MLLGVINCNVYHVTNRSERNYNMRARYQYIALDDCNIVKSHSLFYHESHNFSASLTVSRPYKLISQVVHFAVWTTMNAILMVRVTPISYLNVQKMRLGFGNGHQIMLTAERSRAACLWH